MRMLKKISATLLPGNAAAPCNTNVFFTLATKSFSGKNWSLGEDDRQTDTKETYLS